MHAAANVDVAHRVGRMPQQSGRLSDQAPVVRPMQVRRVPQPGQVTGLPKAATVQRQRRPVAAADSCAITSPTTHEVKHDQPEVIILT